MKYGTISYLFSNGKLLMIKKLVRENDPNSGFYVSPGGKLESFEKGVNIKGRLESVIREIKEETGLELINPKLKGIILFDNFERVFENWKNSEDFLVYVFSCERYKGRLKKKSDEGIPMWVDEHKIKDLPQNEGDKKMYEWIKKGKPFVGVIKHKDKSLDEQGTFVDALNNSPYYKS